jgi:hypothetical protein
MDPSLALCRSTDHHCQVSYTLTAVRLRPLNDPDSLILFTQDQIDHLAYPCQRRS